MGARDFCAQRSHHHTLLFQEIVSSNKRWDIRFTAGYSLCAGRCAMGRVHSVSILPDAYARIMDFSRALEPQSGSYVSYNLVVS